MDASESCAGHSSRRLDPKHGGRLKDPGTLRWDLSFSGKQIAHLPWSTACTFSEYVAAHLVLRVQCHV